MLPNHVRGTGIKTQLRLFLLLLLLMLETFFLSSENDANNHLKKKKLSGDIDLMEQMLNLNVVAAAVSNY